MVIYVDIDETICVYRHLRDYQFAEPVLEHIQKINDLYEDGNTIVYWSSRGVMNGTDWTELTQQQLELWGCKYHELIMNEKPHYDLLICDNSIRIDDI